MTSKYGEVTVGGVEDVVSAEVTASSGAACARCSVTTLSGGFSIGDGFSLSASFGGDSGTIFTGYVDAVTWENPPGVYRIEGRDSLSRALDYFIVVASTDEADWFNPRRDNGSTSPSAVISDILAKCGLSLSTSTGDAGWELGNAEEGTSFQLVSAWDAIQQICSIGAWKVWCDATGNIHMASVLDYGSGGGTFNTGDGGNIISASYNRSNRDLRNRVVVIGENGDYTATASASSPYLPSGLDKTVVVSTDLVGNQEMADLSAAANLHAWNRLTAITNVEAVGSPGVQLYGYASVNESVTGAPGGMITSVTHSIDSNGYITSFEAKLI